MPDLWITALNSRGVYVVLVDSFRFHAGPNPFYLRPFSALGTKQTWVGVVCLELKSLSSASCQFLALWRCPPTLLGTWPNGGIPPRMASPSKHWLWLLGVGEWSTGSDDQMWRFSIPFICLPCFHAFCFNAAFASV